MDQIPPPVSYKTGTLSVIIRPTDSNGTGHEILTQTRRVQNLAYDPLYDNTQEVVGETFWKPRDERLPEGTIGESILASIRRGVIEETGGKMTDFTILGHNLEPVFEAKISTRGEDEYAYVPSPVLVVQTIKGPQPWVFSGFVVEVPSDWEPNYKEADGEASQGLWWNPYNLLLAIKETPNEFMGLHVPLLYEVATMLARGQRP